MFKTLDVSIGLAKLGITHVIKGDTIYVKSNKIITAKQRISVWTDKKAEDELRKRGLEIPEYPKTGDVKP